MGQGQAQRTKTSPGHRIGPEDWVRVLKAYRELPGNHTHAARVTGVDRKTCRRLWNVGIPRFDWGRVPLSRVLELELEKARAARAAEEAAKAAQAGNTQAEAAGARADVVRVRAEEQRLVALARGNALALLSLTVNLNLAGRVLAKRIEETVNQLGKEGAKEPLTLGQAMLMLARVGNLVQKSIGSANQAIELERKLSGDAGEVDPLALEADQMSDDEVLEELARAREVHDRVVQLRVIEGGRSVPLSPTVAGDPAATSEATAPLDPSGVVGEVSDEDRNDDRVEAGDHSDGEP